METGKGIKHQHSILPAKPGQQAFVGHGMAVGGVNHNQAHPAQAAKSLQLFQVLGALGIGNPAAQRLLVQTGKAGVVCFPRHEDETAGQGV